MINSTEQTTSDENRIIAEQSIYDQPRKVKPAFGNKRSIYPSHAKMGNRTRKFILCLILRDITFTFISVLYIHQVL